MKQRHINCKNSRCRICLEDAEILEQKLTDLTSTGNRFDLLGHYHKWLSNKGINPETEFGWFTEKVFDDENIEEFCKEFKQKHLI